MTQARKIVTALSVILLVAALISPALAAKKDKKAEVRGDDRLDDDSGPPDEADVRSAQVRRAGREEATGTS